MKIFHLHHILKIILIFLLKIDLRYSNSIASATVAIKAKAESNLIIAGTKGYIYVPCAMVENRIF